MVNSPLATMKHFKDSLKKTLGACHIYHHQWSTLAADHQVWRCTIHQVVSNFEDSHRANLREKYRRRNIQEASAAIPDQTRPLNAVTATRLACPTSASSAISMTAVDMNCLLHKSSFVKSSQEEEECIYTLIHTHIHICIHAHAHIYINKYTYNYHHVALTTWISLTH